MPINIQSETVVSYQDVITRILPASGGRRVHIGTLHRWRSHGLRGVRLESLKLGGRWHTSLEALQRFFDSLTPGRQATPSPDLEVAYPDRSREALAALAEEGF